MQTPALAASDYAFILRRSLQQSKSLIETIRLYPDYPSPGPLLDILKVCIQQIDEKRFEEIRAQINRTLREHKSIFRYDPGDAVAVGLLKAAHSLLRISAQNIIDNCIKSMQCRHSTASRVSVPSARAEFQNSPNALHDTSDARGCGSAGFRGPRQARLGNRTSVRTFYQGAETTPKQKHNNNSSTHRPSLSPIRSDPTFPNSSRREPNVGRCSSPEPEEWTAEDQANFDYETYVGALNEH